MKIALVLLVLLSAVGSWRAVHADGPPGFKVTTKRADDSVTVQSEKGKTVIAVKSPVGISQAIIERTVSRWPDAVIVRLHLKGLESFRLSNGKITLNAAVGIHNGKPQVRLWQDRNENAPLDEKNPLWIHIRVITGSGEPAQSLPLQAGYFELALPRAFFAENPGSITVNWIDFYR